MPGSHTTSGKITKSINATKIPQDRSISPEFNVSSPISKPADLPNTPIPSLTFKNNLISAIRPSPLTIITKKMAPDPERLARLASPKSPLNPRKPCELKRPSTLVNGKIVTPSFSGAAG